VRVFRKRFEALARQCTQLMLMLAEQRLALSRDNAHKPCLLTSLQRQCTQSDACLADKVTVADRIHT
jgi:hypothetical protein